ncbi:hypothetical protein GRI89_01520 [Altererythrobacter salegens]|uniref:STAS/SEC14 domain-containing protein n=1 Tax=Croceibacterium salegens TaxID=1737568 RepID=A0A6I4SQY1_9SPHN|nr:STAS/SEC14 domain-containing protein [Croceibacterium salegens]MXO58225.1 hypothetical protein [Croceibacterium salegens]
MIEIDLSDPDIVTLRPKGRLSEEDFDNLAKTIDARIHETDKVPNLVIRVDSLPHWDSVGALARHFHFVQVHQKVVRKVAIVGDSPLLAFAPEIADHFVAARIRRFPAAKLAEAQSWARAETDDPGHFEEIDGFPGDVIALRAVGVITGDDYRDTLVPLIEERLRTHEKLKCLIVLGEEYATYTGDAAWADMRLGLSHWNTFTRVALVTDIGWVAKASRLFSPVIPLEIEVFGLNALDEARSWITR